MPYIRTRGNQLLLVHGFRDEGGKVNQQILFTIFSKPEALEVLGNREPRGNPDYFNYLIEEKYPSLKFDWPKVKKAIKNQMDVLPDIYQYKQERVQGQFKEDMVSFLRQLASADPQSTLSAAQLYQDNLHELEFIIELIRARLYCSKGQEANDFNGITLFTGGNFLQVQVQMKWRKWQPIICMKVIIIGRNPFLNFSSTLLKTMQKATTILD